MQRVAAYLLVTLALCCATGAAWAEAPTLGAAAVASAAGADGRGAGQFAGATVLAAPALGPTRRLNWCVTILSPKVNVTAGGVRQELPVCGCAPADAATAAKQQKQQAPARAKGAKGAAAEACDEEASVKRAVEVVDSRVIADGAKCQGKLAPKAQPCYDGTPTPRTARAWAEVSCCATQVKCTKQPNGSEGCLLVR